MSVRDTSIEAFRDQVAKGFFSSQKAALLACVKLHGPATRNQLEERSGIRINAVCGAVNKLLEEKQLMDWRTVKDERTKKTVHLVQVYDPNDLEPTEMAANGQGELF